MLHWPCSPAWQSPSMASRLRGRDARWSAANKTSLRPSAGGARKFKNPAMCLLLSRRRIRAGRLWSPVQTQMARRKFRSNQRHEPSTERSFQEYLSSIPAPQTSRTELMRIVRGGEDTYLELKVKLSNTEKI